jgi:UDPglucose--hexose-1-phosphate uridylyltransferase
MTDLNLRPHRRFNLLTREWVLVSPHRTERPWLGQVEKSAAAHLASYDPQCYLCPGNARAGGVRNPEYESTFVFDNDFAALLPGTPPSESAEKELLIAKSEQGVCRVVCFSPDHSLTISLMPVPEIKSVVDVWAQQASELGSLSSINYVQVFENRGEVMGASNPHPHCQIWASSSIPNEVSKEHASLHDYHARHDADLLGEYLALELEKGERIVCENHWFVTLVPFWAVWPFETIVISRRRVASLEELDESEREGLADILKRTTIAYDRLFEVSFPYTMGFHQRPSDGGAHESWRLHGHYYPPLLRSATIRKFMVGYEMLATPQRDITPEVAAARLRETAA